MVSFNEISKSIIDGNAAKAKELTKAALAANVPAKDILGTGLIPGIREVGKLFSSGLYFLPELLVSGKAMSTAMEILGPELSKSEVPPTGKYAIGTVRGDVHDIGKNIVIMMLKGNGWEVTDLGVDVPPEDFCSAVKEGDYQILGMSALLTTTMPTAVDTIEALKTARLRDKVKIMVGGAPTSKAWADKIGADGYASDAAEAVIVAEALVVK